ncbi:phytanoyl-CoA dioxygenase family protein [Streptomyces sp. NPDC004647]|uniref:phytanoyl-CoA dioxygenase family protein n=1 Tax=Streptomyces sp. NPDC004647 TaxID=3154671 RepID=UPI0033B01F6B
MAGRPAREHLLTSVQMARFVAHGYLCLDGVVPQDINAQALDMLPTGVPAVPYATPVDEAYPEGHFARDVIELPAVAGALRSLVGPDPMVDYHTVHIRPPEEEHAQALHADGMIDVRRDTFDIQLMYYPSEVTLDAGTTLLVPGSHLRRTNESDPGRYQNLRGQHRLVCSAGSVALLDHRLWHCGRRNDTATTRHMFKIRFNPTVPQVRLWNTDDLDDPAVVEELRTGFPWYEQATRRLEHVNRIRLWRAMTGDPDFDLNRLLTRVTKRPGRTAARA